MLRLLDVGTEYAADDDGAFSLIGFFGDDGDEEFKRVRGWVQFTDSPVKTYTKTKRAHSAEGLASSNPSPPA